MQRGGQLVVGGEGAIGAWMQQLCLLTSGTVLITDGIVVTKSARFLAPAPARAGRSGLRMQRFTWDRGNRQGAGGAKYGVVALSSIEAPTFVQHDPLDDGEGSVYLNHFALKAAGLRSEACTFVRGA